MLIINSFWKILEYSSILTVSIFPEMTATLMVFSLSGFSFWIIQGADKLKYPYSPASKIFRHFLFSGLYPQLNTGRLMPEEHRKELIECLDRDDFLLELDGPDDNILGAAAPAYAGDVYPNTDSDTESDGSLSSSDSGINV